MSIRAFFGQLVAARGAAGDPRIEAAFAAVRREDFAGPPPWQIAIPGFGHVTTPDGDPAYLYQDVLVALDPARGINIGEPVLHARCLAAVAPRPGETVAQIGAGSGYYTAILAELAAPGGHVHAYEIDPALAARAAANLAANPAVTLHARSGIAADLKLADIIYVSAGLTQPEPCWLDALTPGGRLIFPLQGGRGWGGMLMVTRGPAGTWPARFVFPAGFIPCVGAQDSTLARRLDAAFADQSWRQVTQLHRGTAPNTTCWFAGDGWWLGTG